VDEEWTTFHAKLGDFVLLPVGSTEMSPYELKRGDPAKSDFSDFSKIPFL
jgi:hypothetical protein